MGLRSVGSAIAGWKKGGHFCTGDGRGLILHPVIAVDAIEGTCFGLVHACFLAREGGQRGRRKQRDFSDKQSRRWLDGAQQAAALVNCGAVLVTVVADREGDIYEDFACRPAGVELLIRAGQDRRLTDGSSLFDKAEMLPEAARMTAVHWRLLTTHAVDDATDARRIVAFYRQRWTIEQLFRALKTQGSGVEALRLMQDGPLEKPVAASLIAAIAVLQLGRERDGTAKRPLQDVSDPDDQPALEAISANLDGKTTRRKNPHPKGSLAFAAWTLARLGGWTGYYGKPGPIVMLHGLVRFHQIKHG
jgi:Transposase DDE domain